MTWTSDVFLTVLESSIDGSIPSYFRNRRKDVIKLINAGESGVTSCCITCWFRNVYGVIICGEGFCEILESWKNESQKKIADAINVVNEIFLGIRLFSFIEKKAFKSLNNERTILVEYFWCLISDFLISQSGLKY